MKKPFSVVIAEDHTLLREGLKSLLSSQPDLKVVGEAADGLEAIRCAKDHAPDLILMDLSMPRMTGLSAIHEIKNTNRKIKIIVVTVHDTDEYILSTLEAGADGYVLKDCHSTELLTAIQQVLAGHHYLSPSISGTVIDRFLQKKSKKTSATPSKWETLTDRERHIVKLIAEGLTNKEISGLLYISTKTVEKHRINLMKKLDIHNVAALTALADEKGLINR
jgi:DNA-binding NarL/FixJ family response regulator